MASREERLTLSVRGGQATSPDGRTWSTSGAALCQLTAEGWESSGVEGQSDAYTVAFHRPIGYPPPLGHARSTPSPAGLLVRMDRSGRPVQLTLEGTAHPIVHAQARPDLEQGFYGATATQVWEVTRAEGESFLLVRDMGRGGWAKVDLADLHRIRVARLGTPAPPAPAPADAAEARTRGDAAWPRSGSI